MAGMTMTMKTFKQYSKEENKGFYINKDGVAVILEPIGNHRPRNNKNVSEFKLFVIDSAVKVKTCLKVSLALF